MTDTDIDTLPPAPAAVPGDEVHPAVAGWTQAMTPSVRVDGWTGEKQRRFLEAVADGSTVSDACMFVRMSPASAYAFRRTARGQAFALGWSAANLVARDRVAEGLLARAIEGQVVEITRADGSIVTKHHFDNRLALTLLARLDRYADAGEGGEGAAPGRSARLVAAEFDAYLDLVGRDGGPARAGLFLLGRSGPNAGGAADAALEPVVALARADRLVRCGTALDGDVDLADLDPARRAEWTAEQWARAEAAGLVALAPAPVEPAFDRQLPQLVQVGEARRSALDEERRERERHLARLRSPVWWDDDLGEWRTSFPPTADFDGDEAGEHGDEDYHRSLTPEEAEVAMRRVGELFDFRMLEDLEAERDEWFGAGGESDDDVEGDVDATSPSPADGPNGPFDVTGQGRPCPAPEGDHDRRDGSGQGDSPSGAPWAKPTSSDAAGAAPAGASYVGCAA